MRLLLATLALLALGLGALWGITRSGTSRGAAPSVPHARTERTEAGALLIALEASAPEAPAPEPEERASVRPTDSARTELVASGAASFPHSRFFGRVQHADGRPAARLTLEVRALGASAESRPLAALESSDDGSFSVECPGRGPFQLRAHRSSLLAARIDQTFAGLEAGAHELILSLPPLARLRGRVVDERGDALRRFRIELEGPAGRLLTQAVSSPDGSFETE